MTQPTKAAFPPATAPPSVLDYHQVLARNREVFLLNHAEEVACWDAIHGAIASLRGTAVTRRDRNGKTRVSFVPFLLLAGRQILIGLDALVSHQSYACWVLLRAALEAALIMGKWEDDPQNAGIWERREQDSRAYRRTYQGRALVSRALPHSAELQSALKHLNDGYEHMNDRYYKSQTELLAARSGYVVQLNAFDTDPLDHEAHVYVATHLVLTLVDSLIRMMSAAYQREPDLHVPVTAYDSLRFGRVVALAASDADRRSALSKLGLWPL